MANAMGAASLAGPFAVGHEFVVETQRDLYLGDTTTTPRAAHRAPIGRLCRLTLQENQESWGREPGSPGAHMDDRKGRMLRLLRLRLGWIAFDASSYPGGPWLNRKG